MSWRHSAEPTLAGLRAHDPFAGGKTILVEAPRLGVKLSGMDVDPLAVQIVKHELHQPDSGERDRTAAQLLKFMQAQAAHLYATNRKGWTPLHYFFVHEVTCLPATNPTFCIATSSSHGIWPSTGRGAASRRPRVLPGLSCSRVHESGSKDAYVLYAHATPLRRAVHSEVIQLPGLRHGIHASGPEDSDVPAQAHRGRGNTKR
jgi:hypothetical protein